MIDEHVQLFGNEQRQPIRAESGQCKREIVGLKHLFLFRFLLLIIFFHFLG